MATTTPTRPPVFNLPNQLTASRLVLALIILQVISSGLNLLGLSAHLTLAIWGAILILVMAVGYLNVRLGGRAAR